MAEPDVPREPRPDLAAFYLFERLAERLGWPIAILLLAVSSGGEAFVKLLADLLEKGAGHFWGFIGILLGGVAMVSLSRRQSKTLREMASRNRQLVDEVERLQRALKKQENAAGV